MAARLLSLLCALFAASSVDAFTAPVSAVSVSSVNRAAAVSMFGGKPSAAPKKAAKKAVKKVAKKVVKKVVKKAAPPKPKPKKVVKKVVKKVAPKKAPPKKKFVAKKVGGSGNTGGSFLKELFSFSIVGGGQGL